MALWRTGRTLLMTNKNDEDTLQEAIDNLDKRISYGDDAPTSNTPGFIYIMTGTSKGIYARSGVTDSWTQIV